MSTIRCELIGKDTSVCVRFFTHDAESLKPWIDRFDAAPCHVHQDYDGNHSNFENDIKVWLASSSCVSAVMFIDSRMGHVSDPSFVKLCAKAKTLGVFIGLFVDGTETWKVDAKTLEPNWVLSICSSREVIKAKANEILGVVRFTSFTKDPGPFTE